MRRVFVCLVLLLAALTVSGQESGNRIYGNNGYYQQRRQPLTNSGTLGADNHGFAVEASVLTNLKPDAFVVVFGVNAEAPAALDSNDRVNAKVAAFIQKLSPLGINRNDIFVDFITQNRVYDFNVSGSEATEKLTGFETKKTVAVRYKSREVFEPIVRAAASAQIFDLIKVDYIVSDFEKVRSTLFAEAVKVIKDKEDKYVKLLGVDLTPVALSNEKYGVSYPSEAYQRYQAFETGDAYVSGGSRLVQRKAFTFFYDAFDASRFDVVLTPLGIEPAVQYTLYLRMQYQTRVLRESEG
ncbi:MAG: SIMPL domain-containing protein [Pyrinomonadaceae bacterium]